MACPDENRAAKTGAGELKTTANSKIAGSERLVIALASAYVHTTQLSCGTAGNKVLLLRQQYPMETV